jgi:hypothetical protein
MFVCQMVLMIRFHTNANGTAATTCEHDNVHRQLAQLHNVLAARFVEICAVMDVQSTLSKSTLVGAKRCTGL